MKLHLPAIVPNEGARLLARRIQAAYRGSLPFASTAMQISVTELQRMVEGDIVPGEELVAKVAQATGDAIQRRDWRVPARAGWFDPIAVAA